MIPIASTMSAGGGAGAATAGGTAAASGGAASALGAVNPYLLGATIAAPILGGVVGGLFGRKADKAAAAAAAQAYAELQKIGLPPDLSKEIILKNFESQGVLTPDLLQEVELQASQVAQIQEDPSLRSAQLEALSTLGQVQRGGLRAEDRSAYNELRAATQRDAEAKRQQILQQMQARGMAGSGAELMTQLQSAQGSADEQSAGADRLAAEASRRALEALGQRANLAGNVRGQDFSAAQTKAQALDDRNRFLYQNSVARQQANVAALNDAQKANLANRQRLSEMNVAQANTESERQNQAKRDYFQDQMNLATAKANALNRQGSVLQQTGQNKADMFSGIGSAIGQGFGTLAKYNQNKKDEDEELY